MKKLFSTSSSRRARSVLPALAIAIAVCGALDIVMRIALPTSNAVVLNRSTRNALLAAPAPDIQIIGDSVTTRSLIAASLTRHGDIRARNDGLRAARPSTSYFLLREQFEAGLRPGAIVFMHTPRSFNDQDTARLAGTFAYWHELPEIYAMADQWTDALYGTFSRFSYILTTRSQLRTLLLQHDYEFFLTPESSYEYKPDDDFGWLQSYLADPSGHEQSEPVFDGRLKRDDRLPFTASEESDAYFRKLLELAERHGVPVFWITPPVPESVHAVQSALGFYEALAEYLAPYEQAGLLSVLELEPAVFADRDFRDSVHPGASARLAFSCRMRAHAGELSLAIAKVHEGKAVRKGAHDAGALLDSACTDAPIHSFSNPATRSD